MDIYRAHWVIPVETPPIEYGFLAVEGGRISAVGAADQITPTNLKSAALHDLGEVSLARQFHMAVLSECQSQRPSCR